MQMTLNEAERETLNAAMAILERCVPEFAHIHIAAFVNPGEANNIIVIYYDSESGQHSDVQGPTLADKVQNALDIEAYVQSEVA